MRVLSVNVATPRGVSWRGQQVATGIFKTPVEGRVRIRTLNVDGDRQADLRVHGGWDKAVYAYPSEFYELWRGERPELALPWGQFGENLTIEGLLDDDVCVGDRFRVGRAELIVTQPRLPCFKLGIKMERDQFVGEFLDRRLLGFYFAVAREGDVEAGDPIVELSRDARRFRVTEITRLFLDDREDVEGLQRAVELDVLSESWRNYFRKALAALGRSRSVRLVPKSPPPAWPGFRPFEIRDKVRESEDVCSFHLRPADGRPLSPYRPGQFLTLRLPDADGPTGQLVRTYSISDRPNADSYRLTVKKITRPGADPSVGLASGILHHRVVVGDVLEAKAPAGLFTIDPTEAYRPAVLVAGGIGITPILAMLNSIAEYGPERETWLFYGVRDDRDHLMRAHLEALADRHPSLRVHVSYSRPRRESGRIIGAPDHEGRISMHLLQDVLPASYYDYYLCGPGPMMRDLSEGLRAWGVPEDRIHSEAFGPTAIKETLNTTTPGTCKAAVSFARSKVATVWRKCDSPLLEVAEASGIAIPFGCRAGNCGTCVTRILSGSVTYLHEPAAPLAASEILPCVAVPDSDVVLDV
jgi:ferredoxin-NADP reductase/MOSC domain-containing protein YiiM